MTHSQESPNFDPVAAFGSARRPDGGRPRTIPDGVKPELVEALGELSEAFEVVENARGHLYAFHRLCGTADLTLQRAVEKLRDAGEARLADDVDQVLVGRNVIADSWSYELIEDYDANYWYVFRAMVAYAHRVAGDVPKHLHEALMQYDEQERKVGG
jgi:hypothetical protein